MARLGQSTPRAALIYQHATAERDHAIAQGLDAIIERGRAAKRRPSDGSAQDGQAESVVHLDSTPDL